MVIFSRSLLGDIDSDVIICPVYDDLTFELKHLRSLKNKLQEKIDFVMHTKQIRYQGLRIGESYTYSPDPNLGIPFKDIIYLTIRTFFDKPYYFQICNAIESLLLEAVNKNYHSIAIPMFYLDCFTPETELHIFVDAILNAYKTDERVAQLQIKILGIEKYDFSTAQEIFAELPKKLYFMPPNRYKQPYFPTTDKKREFVHYRNPGKY